MASNNKKHSSRDSILDELEPETESLIGRLLRSWNGCGPADGDIDKMTGICRCGCGLNVKGKNPTPVGDA